MDLNGDKSKVFLKRVLFTFKYHLHLRGVSASFATSILHSIPLKSMIEVESKDVIKLVLVNFDHGDDVLVVE